jgi:GT2 family glycosyltransferase
VEEKVFSDCIDAILSETKSFPANIYVFENGTPGVYKDVISRLPETSRVSSTSQNIGFPAGANRVIKMGKAPLVLFITDDIILHPGAIDTLIRRMDNPNISQCGLKLLFPEDSMDRGKPAGKVQHIGHAMTIRGEIVHPLLGWSADNPKCCISREVISVTGGVFMVRRKLFERIGGFNEIYSPGYYEDAELSLTLQQLGGTVFIDTNAVATHVTNATFGKEKNLPPITRNKITFNTRCGRFFRWTEWEMV